MARSRIEVQNILEEVLGSRNVYFQPPSNIIMKYPAIVYNMSPPRVLSADNKNYIKHKQYTVTLIHKDPDNDVVDKLEELESCKLNNTFVSEGLNHYVFSLFY